MKITLAQLNPIVGDIAGNLARLRQVVAEAAAQAPDLLVFPELYLTGYPPRDLLERGWFIEACQRAIAEVATLSASCPETGILFGCPSPTGRDTGKGLFNAAHLAYRGELIFTQAKSLLPTYDVFDEARYFEPAEVVRVMPFRGEVLGISICEDAWNAPEFWPKGRMYSLDPIEVQARLGATLLVNISASPFNMGKEALRFRLISGHASRLALPMLYVNQIGGNDELIFDGRSLGMDRQGRPLFVGAAFAEQIATVDMAGVGADTAYRPQDEAASVYDALTLGLRDYLRKCGFSRVVIGLSGGIDSALTACLAVDALGRENVLGISMPSPYSSLGSVEDSRQLASRLGIDFQVIPISEIYQAYLKTLQEPFAGRPMDVAEENIQARIRGNILMAFSNKFGSLVLSTGNKSEMAVGYCTLYGDMSGGLSVISDVPKTLVYRLAAHVNREHEIIPNSTIHKAPSAELRPNQVDQDTLPPYPVLDLILHYYVEDGLSVEEIIAQGQDSATVRWVVRTVIRNEYKRRQAAPGLRVTSKAFGVGRRVPIAARNEL